MVDGWRVRVWVVVSVLLLAGCGNCGDETIGSQPGSDGGDAAPTDGQSSGSDADGAVTDGGGSDDDGCPRYHTKCGDTCLPTHVDPDNCGACGNACEQGEVCSSGSCTDTCLPGRETCGRRCIDTSSDPDNCGECGNACADGEGCIDGSCEEAVDVGDPPGKCADGGPPVDVDVDDGDRCTGNLARTVFRWAICSCDGLDFDNRLETDAYDSQLGRYRPGGLGGSVGTNGALESANEIDVRGTVWASGDGGTTLANSGKIHQQLHSGGDAIFRNTSEILKDAWVEGDVEGQNGTEFAQTLHVNQNATVSDGTDYGKLERTNVDVAQACERCGAADRIPVGEIVSAHAGSNNDNDAIGLEADALASQSQSTVLVLPCGEYYLSEIDIENKTTILAEGRTAIYVDGDIEVANSLTIKPTATGELDVFVSGNVRFQNKAQIGDPAYPASTRFYVGGDEGWKMANSGLVGAYIYAVPGGIDADNKVDLYGGIYTQTLTAANTVAIHYDRGVLDAGDDCPPGDEPDPDPMPDAGMEDGGADTDGGGGGTPMCAEGGESCSSDEDCCVPLVCGEAGTCDVKSCRARGESCTGDGDCCSGTCAEGSGESVCVGS